MRAQQHTALNSSRLGRASCLNHRFADQAPDNSEDVSSRNLPIRNERRFCARSDRMQQSSFGKRTIGRNQQAIQSFPPPPALKTPSAAYKSYLTRSLSAHKHEHHKTVTRANTEKGQRSMILPIPPPYAKYNRRSQSHHGAWATKGTTQEERTQPTIRVHAIFPPQPPR